MLDIHALPAALTLVYPPISNQEAIWLREDNETADQLRKSDFYMIAQRHEAKFSEWTQTSDHEGLHLIHGSITSGNLSDTFVLDFRELVSTGPYADLLIESVALEVGPKSLKIFGTTPQGETLLEWFTTEKLIWERSLERPGMLGLQSVRDFASYELLYAGMAKDSNTFDRLIDGPHLARQNILGGQYPMSPGSRVTDEVFLFAFDIDHFELRTLDEEDALTTRTPDEASARDRAVTADAEKAFITLLRPEYNRQKYNKYPMGSDGLFSSGLTSYGYVINENITFTTSSLCLIGATKPIWSDGHHVHTSGDGADVIVIRGDEVVVVAGTPA